MTDSECTAHLERHRWRFFSSEPLAAGFSISLNAEESHLAQVLRLQTGATIEITDGKGHLAEGRLIEVLRRQASVEIISVEHIQPPPGGSLVFVGKARTTAVEEALESAAQLGALRFVVFDAEKSKNRQTLKIERLQKIAREAARINKSVFLTEAGLLGEQDGLSSLFSELENTIRYQKERSNHVKISVCDETPLNEDRGRHPHLLRRLSQGPRHALEALIIGPEGSLTERERNALLNWAISIQADLQFVSLGNLILTVPNAVRCATALAEAVRAVDQKDNLKT